MNLLIATLLAFLTGYKEVSNNMYSKNHVTVPKSSLPHEKQRSINSIENKSLNSTIAKIDISKIIVNNEFQNLKRDMFGEAMQSFLFSENGKGRASWRWTVNSRLEEGSSELTWQIVNEKIIVKFKYLSKTSETTNEKITLVFNNKNPNCLSNINDKNEKYCKL